MEAMLFNWFPDECFLQSFGQTYYRNWLSIYFVYTGVDAVKYVHILECLAKDIAHAYPMVTYVDDLDKR